MVGSLALHARPPHAAPYIFPLAPICEKPSRTRARFQPHMRLSQRENSARIHRVSCADSDKIANHKASSISLARRKHKLLVCKSAPTASRSAWPSTCLPAAQPGNSLPNPIRAMSCRLCPAMLPPLPGTTETTTKSPSKPREREHERELEREQTSARARASASGRERARASEKERFLFPGSTLSTLSNASSTLPQGNTTPPASNNGVRKVPTKIGCTLPNTMLTDLLHTCSPVASKFELT